jgi:SSS family solute:Na+ symporter
MNVIIIGWVNKAMSSILQGMFGIDESVVMFYVFACMILVAVYSAISGLWGVVITDAFQFFIAMLGCIILAIIVINSPQVGGIAGLKSNLPGYVFDFFPTISDVPSAAGVLAMSFFSFLAYIGIIWWASWYPGAEPGGGGYVAQRMMSAKDEKHSLFATLFFQIAHYAIRPWPWILVGLASLVLYPELADAQKGMGFIYAMRDFLPVGLKGLLVAAFFAAYMSTIATQLNWGTSFIINDFYKRFVSTKKDESHYVLSSRIATILLMLVSLIVTLFISKISGAWAFIIECGAGVGLVLILRWFWWRINAWSEISAMITPFIIFPILKSAGILFPYSLFIIVPGTTLVWVTVTLLTKPTDDEVLFSFYTKIHPGGVMWKKISSQLPEVESDSGFFKLFINWLIGVILVYSILFGTGKLILGDFMGFIIYLVVASIAVSIIYINLSKIGWKTLVK